MVLHCVPQHVQYNVNTRHQPAFEKRDIRYCKMVTSLGRLVSVSVSGVQCLHSCRRVVDRVPRLSWDGGHKFRKPVVTSSSSSHDASDDNAAADHTNEHSSQNAEKDHPPLGSLLGNSWSLGGGASVAVCGRENGPE